MSSNTVYPSSVSTVHGKSNGPTAFRPGNGWSGILQDYDLIEILDMTALLAGGVFRSFHVLLENLNSTPVNIRDTANGLDTTCGQSCREDNDLPTVKEILLKEAQERLSAAGPTSSEGENEEDCNIQTPHRDANTVTADGENKEREVSRPAKSIVIYDTDKPTPKFTYPPGLGPKERHNLAKSFRKEPGSLGDPIVVQDQDTDSGDGDALEEQDRRQESFSTPSTSVVSSGARYLNLHENTTLNTSLPNRRTLSLTPATRTCQSKGENRKNLTPNLSTDRDKKNLWNSQETKADDREEDNEEHDWDCDKKSTYLLDPKKKDSVYLGGEVCIEALR